MLTSSKASASSLYEISDAEEEYEREKELNVEVKIDYLKWA
jgi:hypothetical protein